MKTNEAYHGRTLIRVSIESVQPLAGTAETEAGGELHFDGWLGLLDVLSILVGSRNAPDTRTAEAPNEGL